MRQTQHAEDRKQKVVNFMTSRGKEIVVAGFFSFNLYKSLKMKNGQLDGTINTQYIQGALLVLCGTICFIAGRKQNGVLS